MGQDTILGTDEAVDAFLTKINSDIAEIFSAIAALSGSAIQVSSDDTTPGFLHTNNTSGKLLYGTGIDFTVGNAGGNENLTISFGDTIAKEIEFDRMVCSYRY